MVPCDTNIKHIDVELEWPSWKTVGRRLTHVARIFHVDATYDYRHHDLYCRYNATQWPKPFSYDHHPQLDLRFWGPIYKISYDLFDSLMTDV